MLKKIIQLISNKTEKLQFQPTLKGWLLPQPRKQGIAEDDAFAWASTLPDDQVGQAFYLAQLITEGLATLNADGLIIPWQHVYQILEDETHSGLVESLQLPPISVNIMPVLDTNGTLSDATFTLFISGWRQENKLLCNSQLIGAILRTNEGDCLLPPNAWQLSQAIQTFSNRPSEERTQHQQEMAWGSIRALSNQANARYASRYLEGTIILTPESLKLELERVGDANNASVYVSPTFTDAPSDWLQRFDTHQNIQDHYDFSTQDGRSRVILSEPVKRVLQFIKREMPQRRIVGKKAEAFIRNPYALLGEEMANIIDAPHFKEEKKKLGTLQDTWHLQANTTNGQILSVNLHIAETHDIFHTPEDFAVFLDQVKQSIEEQAISLTWQQYSLTLDGKAHTEWQQGQRILAVWNQQKNHPINYADIYDLGNYGDRVIGIGEVRPVALPILLKNDDGSQSWSPEMEPAIMIGMPDGNHLLVPATPDFMGNLEKTIHSSKAAGQSKVTLPYIHHETSIETAEYIQKVLGDFLQTKQPSATPQAPEKPQEQKSKPKTLLISSNFNTLEYIEQRKAWLSIPDTYKAQIPASIRPSIQLKLHQKEGLRWLQYLSSIGSGCDGALLADDMGLGKTLQALCLLASHYEKHPDSPPSLIVAPVTLLDNWEQEVAKFFTHFPPVLRLHGNNLKQYKQPNEWIDQQLLNEGIINLLQPDWLGKAKLVITTYETVRSYEFSLARQEFTFLICDEAQKIKNPTAITTLAIKKQKARFKIACTGTPVENHLVDLWNLFDWVQPGLLGTIQEFHSRYRRPIETKTEQEKQAIEQLRSLIEPQTLRRTKLDISSELPQKHTYSNTINMASYQEGLYQDTVTRLGQAQQEGNGQQRLKNTWGLLHRIKAICAEPYCLPGKMFIPEKPLEKHLKNSPKMDWLLKQLESIRAKNEKVIIFTELRQVQAALSFFLKQRLGITPSIINGQTQNRQNLIDRFQDKIGFNAIILSPLAAGAGLNIVSANHVIHFTRTWNPAKEAQATDRAYRIGQKKDVHVYCPTITHPDFTTFEAKLDLLMHSKQDLAADMLNGIGGEFALFEFDIPKPQATIGSQFMTLDDVDGLDGDEFEKLCQLLLQKEGWETHQTPKAQGDGGIDIVAIKGTIGLLAQCKRSNKTLGWDAIKEVAAGAARYTKLYPGVNFTKIAMTNQFFNQTAKEQAIHNHVDLWERPDIKNRLQKHSLRYDENLSPFSFC
jgi:superfamily II DNA or RNA helicase